MSAATLSQPAVKRPTVKDQPLFHCRPVRPGLVR